ncbi:MAG: hypothetical protein BHW34_01940 [Firmicutes bacterium CAG:176_59_8]|nr:MAG: hypothetical protein BHW34_01940 [Firmicutes bacterium CAG:176_59_8]
MKLNYKRTILVGFAFFLICSFWQAYDNTIPLILTNKFGMSQTWSGVIMALDNVLALFLLPLFGHISDKCTHPKGRRTPFIVVGTLLAAVALIALSFVDNAQLKHLDKVSAIDDPAALAEIYQEQKDATLLTPGGESFILGQKITQEEFTAIRSQITEGESTVTNPDYTNYVVPARQACAHAVTRTHPGTVVLFVVLLLIILISMATFRSPAVAEAAALQGQRRHQPDGQRRRHSGAGAGHGVRHLVGGEQPDELHRLFWRHRGADAGGAGGVHAHRP